MWPLFFFKYWAALKMDAYFSSEINHSIITTQTSASAFKEPSGGGRRINSSFVVVFHLDFKCGLSVLTFWRSRLIVGYQSLMYSFYVFLQNELCMNKPFSFFKWNIILKIHAVAAKEWLTSFTFFALFCPFESVVYWYDVLFWSLHSLSFLPVALLLLLASNLNLSLQVQGSVS